MYFNEWFGWTDSVIILGKLALFLAFRRVSRKNHMAGGAAKPCLFVMTFYQSGAAMSTNWNPILRR